MSELRHPRAELSALVDGDLEGSRRAEVEAHVAACAACAAVAADLRALSGAARALPGSPPARDLWPEIAARLAPRQRPGEAGPTAEPAVIPLAGRRRLSFSWVQLAAAALAMILVGGGSVWLVLAGRGALPGAGPATVAQRPDMEAVQDPAAAMLAADFPVSGYVSAVAELEEALDASRDRLDPQTVAVVERNIAAIDQAIDDTRRALAADPNSIYLSAHLADQMRRKLDILRTATTLADASL